MNSWARAVLVREHLHVFDGAAPPLDAVFDQQQFQSRRAALHAARLELARAEEGMEGTSCPSP